MNTSESLGDRIRHVRGAINQTDFSTTFGINQNTLSRYERGERTPDADFIKLLCEKLGISAEWLLFGRSPMHPGEASQTNELQTNAPETPPEAAGACPRCAKLEEKLELVEAERRELSAENRQLWKENKELSARNATLEERQKTCCPEPVFKTTQAIPSSNEELRT